MNRCVIFIAAACFGYGLLLIHEGLFWLFLGCLLFAMFWDPTPEP